MNKTLINFLITIKNASNLKKELLKFYFNKKFILLAKILYKEGLIQDFWLEKTTQLSLVIALKYHYNISNYKTLKIVSKPSKSLFFSYKDIFKLYEKHTLYIFSTSLGYLTSLECKQKKIGGILFFYVK